MGRIKKYATEEERVIARRQAAARHYSQNKEYKNKMLMLRYYQKKVEELSLLASSSIENQPSYKKINNEWTREDHGVVLESFIDTSSFQLTAFVSSPIYVEGILPTESITLPDNLTSPIAPTESINISEEFELLQFSYVDKSTDALFNNTIGNIDLTLTSSNLPTDLL